MFLSFYGNNYRGQALDHHLCVERHQHSSLRIHPCPHNFTGKGWTTIKTYSLAWLSNEDGISLHVWLSPKSHNSSSTQQYRTVALQVSIEKYDFKSLLPNFINYQQLRCEKTVFMENFLKEK